MKKIFIVALIIMAGIVFAEEKKVEIKKVEVEKVKIWSDYRDEAEGLAKEGKFIESAEAYIKASKAPMGYKSMPAWMYNDAGYMLIKHWQGMKEQTGNKAVEILTKAKEYLEIAKADVNAQKSCNEITEKNLTFVLDKISKCIVEVKEKK